MFQLQDEEHGSEETDIVFETIQYSLCFGTNQRLRVLPANDITERTYNEMRSGHGEQYSQLSTDAAHVEQQKVLCSPGI